MAGVLTREAARRSAGFVGEVGLKAYGGAAALSVALSDAETLGGKGMDAVGAVPNLVDRYHDAQYVVDHREEVQASLNYLQEHAPDAQELQATADKSVQTLDGIATTWDEFRSATEAFAKLNLGDTKRHVEAAWDAKPDLDSIGQLADVAEDVAPFVEHGEVLIPKIYGNLLRVMDNLAGDELAATLGVIVAALTVTYLLGTAVGFWARRGQPRLLTRVLQRWGVRLFAGWYVDNPHRGLGRPVAAVARERLVRDIVADPEGTLDAESLEALERHFLGRMSHST